MTNCVLAATFPAGAAVGAMRHSLGLLALNRKARCYNLVERCGIHSGKKIASSSVRRGHERNLRESKMLVKANPMKMKRVIGTICLACSCAGWTLAQDTNPSESPSTDTNSTPVLKHRAAGPAETAKPIVKENIDLTVPQGSALQVVLDGEVRIKAVGQPIHGRIVEPVYSFDKLFIPAGTEVNGKISEIEGVPAGARTMAALNANLTPARQIEVEFTELVMADGKHIPIQTSVVPGSGQVLKFVSAAESRKKKDVKDVVTQKERQAKEEARRQYEAVMQEVKRPGKMHRLERAAVAQFPVHPQYVDAGTVYFAELGKALEFGSEPLTAEMAESMRDTDIPPGSMVRARLMTALNSASTQKGDAVQGILSQPLMVNGKLLLPEGTVLKGTVVQVQPARHWKRNGQLRFVFRDLVLPNGVESKVEAMVQGVQSGVADKLNLDSEGGAETQTPKSRYLRTAISVGLAAATHEDEAFNRAEGGAGGFKVVGIVIGAAVNSHPLAIAMGAFGASRSIYNNFMARGRDVVFPKFTAMQIAVDTRGNDAERK
jgi:hypothetical protein